MSPLSAAFIQPNLTTIKNYTTGTSAFNTLLALINTALSANVH